MRRRGGELQETSPLLAGLSPIGGATRLSATKIQLRLLWLPEELQAVVLAYTLKAGFNERTYFFLCRGHFADVGVGTRDCYYSKSFFHTVRYFPMHA
jgi:hypothetical protein